MRCSIGCFATMGQGMLPVTETALLMCACTHIVKGGAPGVLAASAALLRLAGALP